MPAEASPAFVEMQVPSQRFDKLGVVNNES